MAWIIETSRVSDVKARFSEVIEGAEFPSAIAWNWTEDELSVSLSSGGKSEFKLAFVQAGADVTVKETSRKVAMFHKPFAWSVDKKLAELMAQIEAKPV